MAGMNTLQMIKIISKFDGENFVERTRPLNDILQKAWSFLSKMINGLERPEPILSGSREEEVNTSDLYDNDCNPSDVSGHDSGSINEESQNSDDVKTWGSANEYLFSVLRLTTTGAACSVLLKFKRKNGRSGDGRQAWLALKTSIRTPLVSVGEHFCGV